MHRIADRLTIVQQNIHQAANSAQRNIDSITLLGVSKKQPANMVREAFGLGLRDFGENYVQEALAKQQALQDLAICWHFIGPIQSNKTQAIAEHFDWVHSVDRLKIADRLSRHRKITSTALNICLQINIDNEVSKSGFSATDIMAAAEYIQTLPNLTLRGLMVIPAPKANTAEQRIAFAKTAEILNKTNQQLGLTMDTLSMGMSGDMDAAIAEGATMIRIGTALFGPRTT